MSKQSHTHSGIQENSFSGQAVIWISWLFGTSLLLLSAFVSLETVLRKLANISLQGADELGGYVLAIGSSLAFIVALIERAHIRIDIVHRRLGKLYQAILDVISALSCAMLGIFFLYVGWFVIHDTLQYGSTAATPWATPLIWPQSMWYGALVLFALASVALAVRACFLLSRGHYQQIATEFNPSGALDELLIEEQQPPRP